MKVLADRIKEARVTVLGMSQLDLAVALGLHPMTISRWERGEGEPRPRQVRALAELSGRPVHWFYDEAPEAVA